MPAANYSLWPDNGRTPPDLFSAVMIFTPNQDHDDDVRKRTRRKIEGEENGKNLCFQRHELISLC